MSAMQGDWMGLGRAIRDARKTAGFPTQQDLADRVGAKVSTIRAIEQGRNFSKVTPTLRVIERLLGWTHGSVEDVLDGREPTPRSEESAPEHGGADLADGLSIEVARELAGGQVIGDDVLNLTVPGSQDRLVVIYKSGDAGPVNPDELRRRLRVWTDVQRALRGLMPPVADDAEDA